MAIVISPRGACPTLVRPMRTGDGFLARLPPLLVPLDPRQLADIAAAAVGHGNGLVEISSRGNIQIRGVAESGGPALAAALAGAGLDLRPGIPISVDPLSEGETQAAAIRLAADLDDRLEASGVGGRLAPKAAIVLDFGSRFRPAALSADIRAAFRAGRVHLGIGGDAASARPLGSVPADGAAAALFALLERLAEFGPSARLAGSAAMAETDEFIAVLRRLPGFVSEDAGRAPGGEDALAVSGEAVAAIAFPFGQAEAADLGLLASAAEAARITGIAPAPGRRLLFSGSPEAAASVRASAARLGFVVTADDPRQAIFACIGSSGCLSGQAPTRDLAAGIAAAAPSLLDGSFALHVSGCAKGCAHSDPAAITLAAIDKSLAIVLDGRARDPAVGIAPANQIAGRLASLAGEVELRRGPGESSAAVLERIGRRQIEAILLGTGPGDGRGNGSGRAGGEPTHRKPGLSA